MTRYDRRIRLLAACLSALAGYVDAFGFIELGGYFVSFMSGNSTRLGVGLSEPGADWRVPLSLVAAFVLGVMLGTLIGRLAGRRRQPAVLLLVAGLLAAAAAAGAAGLVPLALGLLAIAMGAENAVFERDGEVSIGLTYMTGALVKFGQHLTAALLGGARLAWAPYLLLWLGLVAGAAGGAAVHARLGLGGVWWAAGGAVGLALAAAAWFRGTKAATRGPADGERPPVDAAHTWLTLISLKARARPTGRVSAHPATPAGGGRRRRPPRHFPAPRGSGMISDHRDLDEMDLPLQPAPEVLRAREQLQAGAFAPWARPRALATLLVALLMLALLLLFIEQVP